MHRNGEYILFLHSITIVNYGYRQKVKNVKRAFTRPDLPSTKYFRQFFCRTQTSVLSKISSIRIKEKTTQRSPNKIRMLHPVRTLYVIFTTDIVTLIVFTLLRYFTRIYFTIDYWLQQDHPQNVHSVASK